MTATNSKPRSPIHGAVYPKSKLGFAKFLVEANALDAEGYELVALIPVEKTLAAVWKRVRVVGQQYSDFIGDEGDEEPILNYG